jgi:hypothetical protein
VLHLQAFIQNHRVGRLQATAVAEVAQLGEQVAEALGVLGIGAAGLFVALWNTEKSAKAAVEQELQQTKVSLFGLTVFIFSFTAPNGQGACTNNMCSYWTATPPVRTPAKCNLYAECAACSIYVWRRQHR